MLFSNPSPVQKFTPKTISFSQLYKTGTGSKKVGSSVLNKAKEVLAKAGYEDKKISQIITNDAKIPVKQMKEIAILMNKAKVYGFQKTPQYLIQQLLTKERVKAQNIARIKREHILEAIQEDLGSNNSTVSLINPRAKNLNTTKPNNKSKTYSSSLIGNSNNKTTSLSANNRLGESLGNRNKGITFKPNF